MCGQVSNLRTALESLAPDTKRQSFSRFEELTGEYDLISAPEVMEYPCAAHSTIQAPQCSVPPKLNLETWAVMHPSLNAVIRALGFVANPDKVEFLRNHWFSITELTCELNWWTVAKALVRARRSMTAQMKNSKSTVWRVHQNERSGMIFWVYYMRRRHSVRICVGRRTTPAPQTD